MQAVERAHSEFWAVAARQVGAEFEGSFRDRALDPKLRDAIAIQLIVESFSNLHTDFPEKDLLSERVPTFRDMQGRKP